MSAWYKRGNAKKKACFSPYTARFTPCEFSFPGNTLWLAKHGKMLKIPSFAQNKGHDMNSLQKNDINKAGCTMVIYIKKDVNTRAFTLNGLLVQTHLGFRCLAAYSKRPPMLGECGGNKIKFQY